MVHWLATSYMHPIVRSYYMDIQIQIGLAALMIGRALQDVVSFWDQA